MGLTPVALRLRAWWPAGSPAWRLGGWRNPDPCVRAGVAAGMSSGHLTSQLNQCRGGVVWRVPVVLPISRGVAPGEVAACCSRAMCTEAASGAGQLCWTGRKYDVLCPPKVL